MITTGYSNPTPWNTERELSEAEIGRAARGDVGQVEDPANAVAVIHAPPAQTALDAAPELGDDLTPQGRPGRLQMTHVGSSAVREWLERRSRCAACTGTSTSPRRPSGSAAPCA